MSRSFDRDDPSAIGDRFAEDLRSAHPETDVPARIADDHVGAMMAAARTLVEEDGSVLEPASRSGGLEGQPTSPRRRWMRERMIRRVIAVAAGLVLSLGGLALAGAFPGSGDPGDDDVTVADLYDDNESDVADDQAEDGDDQGDNDQGDNEQGEDGDDQGEDGDDQGEDDDDQGEDDQGDQGDDDQGDQGDDDHGDDDEGDDSQD